MPQSRPANAKETTSPAIQPDRHDAGYKAALSIPVFRRIWSASLFSNLGQNMQSVAAAWAMLQITHRADQVALVQTASAVPFMLMAIAAGAIADMYDRRKVAMTGLGLCFVGSGILAVAAVTGSIAPHLILLACVITGAGYALYSPSWQASATELVGVRSLPSAVALFSLSANAARSVGPALGGVIIAVAGMEAAFSINVFLFLPIIVALALWKRKAVPPRLPPERLDRAMLSGARYVRHSPPMRRVVFRTVTTAFGAVASTALMPLLAHDRLHGGPDTFGVLLGCYGAGAVAFGVLLPRARRRFTPEQLVRACSAISAAALLGIGFSSFLILSALASMLLGGAWMVLNATYNVSIQTGAPRWVGGRALAMYQTSLAAGMALGAIVWGHLAADHGATVALAAAAAYMLASLALGLAMPLSSQSPVENAPPLGSDPLIKMALTGRSGPIAIEVEYRVASDDARSFYDAMREVRRSRERNGAFNTSLARDITDPELWIERYHYPTWNDYLRSRDRPTLADREVVDRALSFHSGPSDPRIRRMLERPIGSVRWREDAFDPGETLDMPVLLSSAGQPT